MAYPIDLVFWDWVGTLAASDFMLNFCIEQVAADNGKVGVNRNNAADNFSKTEIEQVRHCLRSLSPNFVPYAWSLVQSFSKVPVRQVIVSNGSYYEIERLLELAPFKDFDLILTSDKFPAKPDKAMFVHALDHFKIDKKRAIFIGDTTIDQTAAQNLDMRFFMVDGRLQSYKKIADAFGLGVPTSGNN